MNRIAILLGVSILVCAAALGQSSRSLHIFTGDSDHGWLGVSVQDVTKKLAEREDLKATAGAYVSDVVRKSPAEAAGILEGDVIVKFGSREIDDGDDLIAAVRKSDPGEEVAVVVNRAGETRTLKATLEEMETPRAYTLKVPPLPDVRLRHPAPFVGGFYRSGERLGLEMQDLSKQLAEFLEVPGNRGVLVSSVSKNSSAGTAGFKAGDVIVAVNRNSVRDVDDVLDELRDAKGETVPFEVVRKGKSLTLSVEVDEDRGDTSFFDDRAKEEIREALRELNMHASDRKEMMRGLKESLRDLQRELKEGALELRDNLREELRSF